MQWVFLVAVFFSVYVNTTSAQAFQNFEVSAGDMLPMLWPDDVIVASLYGVDYEALAKGQQLVLSDDPRFQPHRGDVAIFTGSDGRIYIKRIVGLGGDQIRMVHGMVHLNGKALPTQPVGPDAAGFSECDACSYLLEKMPGESGSHIVMSLGPNGPLDDTDDYWVPDGHYFLIGDNRDNSNDSRSVGSTSEAMGYVPREAMIGHFHALLLRPRTSLSVPDP